MRLLAIVIALLLLAPEAHAQTKKQRLKGWELTSEKDRFSGKLDTVIGSSLQQSTALFIRCLHGEQSIAVAHVSFGPTVTICEVVKLASSLVATPCPPSEVTLELSRVWGGSVKCVKLG